MEFLKDWQFWFAIINLIGVIGVFFFQWYSHSKIVGNDLHHLALDLKEIKLAQTDNAKSIGEIKVDIAFLKGKDVSNNKLVEVLQKTLSKVK